MDRCSPSPDPRVRHRARRAAPPCGPDHDTAHARAADPSWTPTRPKPAPGHPSGTS